MKGFNAFILSLLLTLQAVVGAGQTNPVEEYTVRIETKDRSGRLLPATLTITNEKTRKVQRGTLQLGSYTVALPAGNIYRLDANYAGYRPAQKILRLDRVTDPEQSQQTIVLEMEREVSAESPVNVTVVDYDTKQLIRQKLNVQIQEFNGKRVIMTGPPREGRFTFLAEFGQKIRFTVEVDGYQPYEYTVDVKDQHDITIRLQRAKSPVVAETQPTAEPVSPAATPPVVTPPATTSPPVVAETKPVVPEAKPATGAAPVNTDLATLTTGKTVTLNNVYFDQSSYLLRPESYTQLNQLVALLKSRPGLRIEISGHTDNVGDPRLNLALSENRARVITTYLTTNGIAENRLRFKGYGQTKPIAANDTEENKRKNRRVEVRLLDG
ncbi:OmpA family protein [Larkinella sp. C7]|jgi:outer membrane protein OmpA-like peptidoglycan-associated protein|uniref:OmpA family protein n=1 Tax=Larkinella sp. C7 TaxID=2576607 RepID=UPI001E31263F|nr:OmpA family protein [Larkinella sp. C7]